MVLRGNWGRVEAHQRVVPLGDEAKQVVTSKTYVVQIYGVLELFIVCIHFEPVHDDAKNLSPTDWGSSSGLEKLPPPSNEDV